MYTYIYVYVYIDMHVCIYMCACIHIYIPNDGTPPDCYGVATISRIDKIIGLFCRISSLL